MKHLGLFVLRELTHFRGWFLLLAGLGTLTVALHFLLVTVLAGEGFADYLETLRTFFVPLGLVVVCGLIGYADAPDIRDHELRTRPVRLKMLYLGKIFVVVGCSAILAMLQSLLNLGAGFPPAFWSLWWIVMALGFIGFFVGGIFRPTVGLLIYLFLVIMLVPYFVVLLGGIFGGWSYGFLDFRKLILVVVFYLGLVFLMRERIRLRWLHFSLLSILAFHAACCLHLLPPETKRGSFQEARWLGSLPIEVGAELEGGGVNIELVSLDRKRGTAKLRVHCRTDRSLGVFALRMRGRSIKDADVIGAWRVSGSHLPGLPIVRFVDVEIPSP